MGGNCKELFGKSFFEKGGFRQQCPVWFLQSRMLVIHSPTVHKFTDVLLAPRKLLPPHPLPHWGEDIKMNSFNALWLVIPAKLATPSPPDGGRATVLKVKQFDPGGARVDGFS
jgi:hypothetical protein